MKSKLDLASRRATLLALFALGATLLVAPANAATYTVNLTDANLYNFSPGGCSGWYPGERPYACYGIQDFYGFRVPSSIVPAGETVSSVTFEYNPGIDCMGPGWQFTFSLNGTPSTDTFTHLFDECWCESVWGYEPTATLDMPASAWLTSGDNLFLYRSVTAPFFSCLGPQKIPSLGGTYGTITIETGGGGGVECDLSPIEAKLDDEFRFTDDDEAAEVRDEWNGQLAALEAKMDDLTMGLCDLVRLLHTPSGIRSADCGGQHYEWNDDGTLHD